MIDITPELKTAYPNARFGILTVKDLLLKFGRSVMDKIVTEEIRVILYLSQAIKDAKVQSLAVL